jgi:hypothetical protein
LLVQKCRNGDGRQDANDDHNDQQFHQREAGLKFAAFLRTLETLEQRALGQKLGSEAGDHGKARLLVTDLTIALFCGCANRGKLSRI